MAFRIRSYIIAYSAAIAKNKGILLMRSILLLTMLAFIAPLSACADDGAETSDSSASSEQTAQDQVGNLYNINGHQIPLAADDDKTVAMSAADGVTFKLMAMSLAKRRDGVSTSDVLKLNGWTGVADEEMPKGVKFKIHPSLELEP